MARFFHLVRGFLLLMLNIDDVVHVEEVSPPELLAVPNASHVFAEVHGHAVEPCTEHPRVERNDEEIGGREPHDSMEVEEKPARC